MAEVAAGHGVTPAQVRIAWTLAQGPHVLAIPGTGRPRPPGGERRLPGCGTHRGRPLSVGRRASLECACERRPREDRLQRLRRRPRGDRLGGAAHRRRHPSGAHRPAGVAEADRQRELRLAGRAAHDGHLVQRQVRRGHHRPPLLRRLPERRHGRDDRGRARARAVRGAVRLCPAALGDRRQPGGVLVDPGPPRRDAGAGEARAPRTSTSSVRRRLGVAARTSSATSGCSACRSTRVAT